MKSKVKLNLEVNQELNKNVKTISLWFLIVGAVGLVAYILVFAIFENLEDSYLLNVLLIESSIFFGVGIVYLILINKAIKKIAV